MSLHSLWTSFKVIHHSRANALRYIQPRERFRDIIARERVRADRNQHVFSLLLFKISDSEANNPLVQDLAHALFSRIRLTDEVGWFDIKHIGVLLPYASTVGAQTFADDICKAITAKIPPLEYTIHTYPSKLSSTGNGHSAQLHFEDEGKTTTSQNLFGPEQKANEGNSMLGNQLLSTDTVLSCEAFAQTIESFFLHHLPVWKRAMDFVCALLGLVVLSPILLLIALIIKITSPGPIFYKQHRIGHFGKVFTMWKFRTMGIDTDTSQHQQHVHNLVNGQKPLAKLAKGFQTTLFGIALRASCLDELPQLINVLCGDMSFVGPRPDVTYARQYYTDWRTERFHVVPGMTGLWQVNGKNKITFDEMIRLDITYVRQMTFWLDLKIILKTLPVIITQIIDVLFERN